MARGGEVNKSGNLQDGAWRRYSWWPERMTPRALCVLYPSSSSPSPSSSPPPPPPIFFSRHPVQYTNSPPYHRRRLNLTRTPPPLRKYTHTSYYTRIRLHTYTFIIIIMIYTRVRVCVYYISLSDIIHRRGTGCTSR